MNKKKKVTLKKYVKSFESITPLEILLKCSLIPNFLIDKLLLPKVLAIASNPYKSRKVIKTPKIKATIWFLESVDVNKLIDV